MDAIEVYIYVQYKITNILHTISIYKATGDRQPRPLRPARITQRAAAGPVK